MKLIPTTGVTFPFLSYGGSSIISMGIVMGMVLSLTKKKFKEKGLMALLGSGFDPGVTNVFTAFNRKHHLDSIDFLDILDCNDGDHGYPFATNFNPEINIREITSDSKHWENNQWKIGPALKKKVSFKFPEIIW